MIYNIKKFLNIGKLVGNTPLINYKDNIYCKFECYNPTGSIKDRVVYHIFNKAIQNNSLSNIKNIIEASSGNTGISTAFFSSLLNIPCKIIMPSDMSEERKKYIKLFGAELIEVEPGNFSGAIELRNKLCNNKCNFNVNQFHNKLNIECHYETTGKEIVEQFKKLNKKPDILITGTGTGGTLMGVSKRLKEINPNLIVVVVEPDESPVMSGGKPGLHKIQGIGDGSKFLADMNIIDDIVRIKSNNAIEKMKELHKEGYFVGISSAANILTSEKISNKYPKHNIITFMCDRGDRYLSMI